MCIRDRHLRDIVAVVDQKKNYLIIKLLENKTKNDLLKGLIELDINIEKFSIYQPTLEDIFVSKVGDK